MFIYCGWINNNVNTFARLGQNEQVAGFDNIQYQDFNNNNLVKMMLLDKCIRKISNYVNRFTPPLNQIIGNVRINDVVIDRSMQIRYATDKFQMILWENSDELHQRNNPGRLMSK